MIRINQKRHAGIATLVAVSCLVQVSAAQYDVFWYTLDGGGGYCSGSGYEIEGTVGQHDAHVMTGGEYTIVGGFWSKTATVATLPGDCDSDGDIDLDDYECFAACLTGPDAGLTLNCSQFDFDADNDVDMLDYAEFSMAFDGGA